MRIRLAATLTATLVVLIGLSGCFALGSSPIDTELVATEVTATTNSIESTTVETSVDGLTTLLYVRPVITSAGLTRDELDAVLRVAYTLSVGKAATIEIRTVDLADEPVDLEPAAIELGIHYLPHTNSISYSTTVLAEKYGP